MVSIVPIQTPDWISVEEVAAWLRISRTKAYQWAADDMPGVLRLGKTIRVNRSELERWAREQAGARP